MWLSVLHPTYERPHKARDLSCRTHFTQQDILQLRTRRWLAFRVAEEGVSMSHSSPPRPLGGTRRRSHTLRSSSVASFAKPLRPTPAPNTPARHTPPLWSSTIMPRRHQPGGCQSATRPRIPGFNTGWHVPCAPHTAPKGELRRKGGDPPVTRAQCIQPSRPGSGCSGGCA